MLKMSWIFCLQGFALVSDVMVKPYFPLAFLILLAGCFSPPQVPMVQNPFPITPVSDSLLEDDFQALSTDPGLLSYGLVDVRKGSIAAQEPFQVPFVAPAGHDLVLVASCGLGCVGANVTLAQEGENSQGKPVYNGRRGLAYHRVGSRSEALVGSFNLKSCSTATCAAYVALYARAR